MKGFLTALTFFSVLQTVFASVASIPVLKLSEGFVKANTAQYVEYLFSAQSFAEVRATQDGWAPLVSEVLQERVRNDRLWLRMRLANPGKTPLKLVLVSGEARTDTVLFYLTEADQLRQTAQAGDLLDRASPPKYLAANFPFEVAAGSQAEILIATENPVDLAADFTLVRAEYFAEFGGFQYLLQGIFFGALTVLIIYYGVIYLSRRTNTVGAYFWYLLATAVFFAARSGLLFQAVAYGHAAVMNLLVTPLPGVLFATGIRFARAFLKLERATLHDRILQVAQYASLLPVPVAFFSRGLSREICDWLTLILGPGLLVFAWAVRRQVPDAKLFLFDWCWPIIASLLQYTGLDTSYLMRNVMLQSSILMEFVFFSIFIGRDLSRLERERSVQSVNLLMLQEDLEQARRVHATLLPSSSPDVSRLEVRQLYRPMSELGGDYYDWIKLSDTKLVMFVADVTGHGLPAALDAAVVHIAFQTAVVETASAAGILTAMNQSLISQGVDRCISAVCAIYDTASSMLEVSLAGHPQAIVVSAGHASCVGEYGSLLGFSAQSIYTPARMMLKEGDRLFLCTDGAYENPDSQFDDDYAEFAGQLAAMGQASLQTTVNATVDYFDKRRGYRNFDDITLVGAQVLH